jgi:hypothetical protein
MYGICANIGGSFFGFMLANIFHTWSIWSIMEHMSKMYSPRSGPGQNTIHDWSLQGNRKKNDEKPHRSVNIPSQATDALLALPPFFSRPWKLTSGCFRKEELIPAVMKNIVYLIRSVISYLFLFRKKREPHYPLTWLLETFWIPKCCETCDFPTAILNSMEVLVRGEFPAPEGTSPHWFSLFM